MRHPVCGTGLRHHAAGCAGDAGTADRALGDTLQLARRFKLSSYDASYPELALREGLPLAALDADLREAMSQTGGTLI